MTHITHRWVRWMRSRLIAGLIAAIMVPSLGAPAVAASQSSRLATVAAVATEVTVATATASLLSYGLPDGNLTQRHLTQQDLATRSRVVLPSEAVFTLDGQPLQDEQALGQLAEAAARRWWYLLERAHVRGDLAQPPTPESLALVPRDELRRALERTLADLKTNGGQECVLLFPAGTDPTTARQQRDQLVADVGRFLDPQQPLDLPAEFFQVEIALPKDVTGCSFCGVNIVGAMPDTKPAKADKTYGEQTVDVVNLAVSLQTMRAGDPMRPIPEAQAIQQGIDDSARQLEFDQGIHTGTGVVIASVADAFARATGDPGVGIRLGDILHVDDLMMRTAEVTKEATLRVHDHEDYDEYYDVEDDGGGALLQIGNQAVRVQTDDLVRIPAGTPHTIRPIGNRPVKVIFLFRGVEKREFRDDVTTLKEATTDDFEALGVWRDARVSQGDLAVQRVALNPAEYTAISEGTPTAVLIRNGGGRLIVGDNTYLVAEGPALGIPARVPFQVIAGADGMELVTVGLPPVNTPIPGNDWNASNIGQLGPQARAWTDFLTQEAGTRHADPIRYGIFHGLIARLQQIVGDFLARFPSSLAVDHGDLLNAIPTWSHYKIEPGDLAGLGGSIAKNPHNVAATEQAVQSLQQTIGTASFEPWIVASQAISDSQAREAAERLLMLTALRAQKVPAVQALLARLDERLKTGDAAGVRQFLLSIACDRLPNPTPGGARIPNVAHPILTDAALEQALSQLPDHGADVEEALLETLDSLTIAKDDWVSLLVVGGSGTRLFPEGRAQRPKQYLSFDGTRQLVQEVALRLLHPDGPGIIVVQTGRDQIGMLEAALEALPAARALREQGKLKIYAEPQAADTAAAIFYAAAKIEHDFGSDKVVTCAWSDHLIPEEQWPETHATARKLANRLGHMPYMGTIGIAIEKDNPQLGHMRRGRAWGPVASTTFTEKPDLTRIGEWKAAGIYGEFAHHTGYVTGRVGHLLLDAVPRVAGQNTQATGWKGGSTFDYATFIHDRLMPALGTPQETAIAEEFFAAVAAAKKAGGKQAVDPVLLEPLSGAHGRLLQVVGNYTWADIGNLEDWSDHQIAQHPDILDQATGNAVIRVGGTPTFVNARNNRVFGQPGVDVTIEGLDNLIVDVQSDVVVVIPRKEAANVKEIIGALEKDATRLAYAANTVTDATVLRDTAGGFDHEKLKNTNVAFFSDHGLVTGYGLTNVEVIRQGNKVTVRPRQPAVAEASTEAIDASITRLQTRLSLPALTDSARAELLTLAQTVQDMLSADGKLSLAQIIDQIHATNLDHPYRLQHALPLTCVFHGAVYPTYPGGRPRFIAVTVDPEFVAVNTVFSDAAENADVLAKGGTRWYQFSTTDGFARKLRGEGTTPLLTEDVRLAEAMGKKNPWSGVFFDGGKTVFAARPGASKERVIRRWVGSSITAGMLMTHYIAGPDVDTGGDPMAWMVDEADTVQRDLEMPRLIATTSRLPGAQRGSYPHDEWRVTSITTVETMVTALEDPAVRQRLGIDDTSLIPVAIQSFGDAGPGIIADLVELKATDASRNALLDRIVIAGASDSKGTLYDPTGLNTALLLELSALRTQRRAAGEPFSLVEEYLKREPLADHPQLRTTTNGNDVLFQGATVIIPGALPDVFTTAEHIRQIREQGTRMIVEAANNSVAFGIEQAIHEQGLLFFYGPIANFGGIWTSTREVIDVASHDNGQGEEWIRDHFEQQRGVIQQRIREIARSGTRWLLARHLATGQPIHAIHEEAVTRIRRRRAELLQAPNGEMGRQMERLQQEGVPLRIARLIAATELARAEIIPSDLATGLPRAIAEVWGSFDAAGQERVSNLPPEAQSDLWRALPTLPPARMTRMFRGVASGRITWDRGQWRQAPLAIEHVSLTTPQAKVLSDFVRSEPNIVARALAAYLGKPLRQDSSDRISSTGVEVIFADGAEMTIGIADDSVQVGGRAGSFSELERHDQALSDVVDYLLWANSQHLLPPFPVAGGHQVFTWPGAIGISLGGTNFSITGTDIVGNLFTGNAILRTEEPMVGPLPAYPWNERLLGANHTEKLAQLNQQRGPEAKRLCDRITGLMSVGIVMMVADGFPADQLRLVTVSVPGPAEGGVVGNPPMRNIPYENYDLHALIEQGLQAALGISVPVEAMNDALAARLGEGADAIMIWGTGIGIADVHGQIIEGGHATVLKDGHFAVAEKYLGQTHPKLAAGESELEVELAGPALERQLAAAGFVGWDDLEASARDSGASRNRSAIEFLERVAGGMGQALAALLFFYHQRGFQPNRFVLVSTVAEKLGLGLVDAQSRDLVFGVIQDRAERELIEHFQMAPALARQLAQTIARTQTDRRRESLAAAVRLRELLASEAPGTITDGSDQEPGGQPGGFPATPGGCTFCSITQPLPMVDGRPNFKPAGSARNYNEATMEKLWAIANQEARVIGITASDDTVRGASERGAVALAAPEEQEGKGGVGLSQGFDEQDRAQWNMRNIHQVEQQVNATAEQLRARVGTADVMVHQKIARGILERFIARMRQTAQEFLESFWAPHFAGAKLLRAPTSAPEKHVQRETLAGRIRNAKRWLSQSRAAVTEKVTLKDHLNYDPVETGMGTSGVRGKVGEMRDFEPYAITAGFIDWLIQKGQITVGAAGKPLPGQKLAIALDYRDSSPGFAAAAIQAAEAAGIEVVSLGALPTPAMAYYCQLMGIPGIMMTGSHTAGDRNGLKLYDLMGEVLNEAEAGDRAPDRTEIVAAIKAKRRRLWSQPFEQSLFNEDGRFKVNPLDRLGTKLEHVPLERAARRKFVERFTAAFPGQPLKGKVMIYWQHSAVARDLHVEILKALGMEVITIGRRDDVFTALDTEDMTKAHLKFLREEVEKFKREHQARTDERGRVWVTIDGVELEFLGLGSSDGDGDRPVLVTEKGDFIRGDVTSALVAETLGARVFIQPLTGSEDVPEFLAARGIKGPRSSVGSPYVVFKSHREMEQDPAAMVMGGEVNGGVFLSTAVTLPDGRTIEALNTRDAAISLITCLLRATQDGAPTSKLFEGTLDNYRSSAGLIHELPVPPGVLNVGGEERPDRTGLRLLNRYTPPTKLGITNVVFDDDAEALIVTYRDGRQENSLSYDDASRNEVIGSLLEIRRQLQGLMDEVGLGFPRIARMNFGDRIDDGFLMWDDAGTRLHVRPSGNAEETRDYAYARHSQARASEINEISIRYGGFLQRLEASVWDAGAVWSWLDAAEANAPPLAEMTTEATAFLATLQANTPARAIPHVTVFTGRIRGASRADAGLPSGTLPANPAAGYAFVPAGYETQAQAQEALARVLATFHAMLAKIDPATLTKPKDVLKLMAQAVEETPGGEGVFLSLDMGADALRATNREYYLGAAASSFGQENHNGFIEGRLLGEYLKELVTDIPRLVSITHPFAEGDEAGWEQAHDTLAEEVWLQADARFAPVPVTMTTGQAPAAGAVNAAPPAAPQGGSTAGSVTRDAGKIAVLHPIAATQRRSKQDMRLPASDVSASAVAGHAVPAAGKSDAAADRAENRGRLLAALRRARTQG